MPLLDPLSFIQPIEPDNIPAALKEIPSWVNWKATPSTKETGKFTKPPVDKFGYPIPINNKDKFRTYKSVLDSYALGFPKQIIHGIGFVLTDDNDVVGIDIDNIEGPLKVSSLNSFQKQVFNFCKSYVEVSPSGKGLRIFLSVPNKAELIRNMQLKKVDVELYKNNRYLTVTGHKQKRIKPELRTLNADEAEELMAIFDSKAIRLSKGEEEYRAPENRGDNVADFERFAALNNAKKTRDTITDPQVRRALDMIDPNRDGDSYEQFVKVGMALHFHYEGLDTGLVLWDAWAKRGDNYNSYDFNKEKWTTFADARPGAKPLTASYLLALAKTFRPVFPFVDTKGMPLKHTDNVKAALAFLGIYPRLNLMDDSIYLGSDAPIDVMLTRLADHLMGLGFGRIENGKLYDFIQSIAYETPFHPIKEWLSHPENDWNPKRDPDFISMLFNTWTFDDEVTEAEQKLYKTLLVKWLVSGMAVLYSKSATDTEGMLTLQGAQGIGKSRWTAKLVPKEYSRDWVLPGYIMALSGGASSRKDSYIEATQKWITELAEFDATLSKSSTADLKNFLTRSTDTYRKPYARASATHQRRTVFIASVNSTEILMDSTGSRRFWVIPLKALDHNHKLHTGKLWSQVKKLYYDKGYPHWLDTPAQKAALWESNLKFRSSLPLADMFYTIFDFDQDPVAYHDLVAERTGSKNKKFIGLTTAELFTVLGLDDLYTKSPQSRKEYIKTAEVLSFEWSNIPAGIHTGSKRFFLPPLRKTDEVPL